MNVACTTCAPSNLTAWHELHWKAMTKRVKKLQLRIAKAVKEGRWNKVKALQRLLTSSFSAKALAVRRVTENRGKKTAGVDKETWSTPQQKAQAITRLNKRGYKPQPLRRVYIAKDYDKQERRPLSIPCMLDRAMQSLHLLALVPIAETTADKHSYGFRPERNTADAMEQCFNVLCQSSSAKYVLEGDIRKCFDTISHPWLEANIPMDKRILKQWLKAGFMDQGAWQPTEAGVPQGSPISPVMTNLCLDGLEALLKQHFHPRLIKGKWLNPQVNLIKFADDFIVTARSIAILNEVKLVIEAFLAERGLALSTSKTRISHSEDGFDFLGQNVRKYQGKLIIQPAKKNVKAFLAKVRQLIKRHQQSSQADLIACLNPVIKGWANFHRHSCASDIFSKVDHLIWMMLWRWTKRRHPTKSAAWRKQRYFLESGSNAWNFACQVKDNSTSSGSRLSELRHASATKIRRHIKIRADANPFDPDWESYFEQRLQHKMLHAFQGRKQLRAIWQRQDGKCLTCSQNISQASGWHLHHLLPKAQGGSHASANLVLLHPTCHQQIHHNLDLAVKLLALTHEGS